MERRWIRWPTVSFVVLALTLAVLCVPVLVDLVGSPQRRPFGYVAADAFYYLSVARNAARTGTFAFDGEHATNGFHPLWQLLVTALYFVAEHAGLARHAVLLVVLASLGLVAGGVLLLGLGLWRWAGRLTPAFLVLPVGVYALFLVKLWAGCRPVSGIVFSYEGPLPLYGTLWSFVNGMESGCALLAYGALAYVDARAARSGSNRSAWAFGATASMLALARLDHVLLVLPIVGGFVGGAWLERERRGQALRALAAFALPLVAYVTYNRAFFGSVMPSSGQVKSTFPYPTADHVYQLKALLDGTSCESLAEVFREAQTFIPILAALGALPLLLGLRVLPSGFAVHLRRPGSRFDRFVALTAFGVLALGAYNLFFATAAVQGHWYFPISTLFVSLVVVNVVERVPWSPPLALNVILIVAIAALSVVCFATLHRRPEYHARWAKLYWDEAPRVRAHYGAKRPKLVEIDDGIVNFSLDFRATSHALVLDPEGLAAYEQKRLLPLAMKRGFDRITTFTYRNALELRNQDGARTWVANLFPNEPLHQFTFEVDYLSKDGAFGIVRMSRAK